MKKFNIEIIIKFDEYHWCGGLFNSTSYEIDDLINDDFFILGLTEGIKLGLK